jgi:hypothetical protein
MNTGDGPSTPLRADYVAMELQFAVTGILIQQGSRHLAHAAIA